MNNKLIVKIANSTDDIPIKYGVIEITVGTTAANTFVTMQTIDVGWDTFANYELWKASKSPSGDYSNPGGRDWAGMQGTIGEIIARRLDEGAGDILAAYQTFAPSMDRHA